MYVTLDFDTCQKQKQQSTAVQFVKDLITSSLSRIFTISRHCRRLPPRFLPVHPSIHPRYLLFFLPFFMLFNGSK